MKGNNSITVPSSNGCCDKGVTEITQKFVVEEVREMDNILDLALDADLPTTVLKINAILTEMKSKGLMVADTP